MLATSSSLSVNSRNNNNTTTMINAPTTSLLTKNNLLAFHHFQQHLDATSSNLRVRMPSTSDDFVLFLSTPHLDEYAFGGEI
ncbi:unnamed protein product [Rotaria magnacalcarata]|uniref:Uncharacterized protein n=1 Tax=Rotaria magnacalcarata TaxID=392030 RepID=A0A8S3FZC9_9BILA|nr:unnamed protein product [Rotaria magnacalcarata]CAF5156037.1 unnamed protein product [Rotaria magnacalcarata]